ncbi:beta-ketoacyl synthase-like protein [Lachnotalea glycerini]|uniref:Beta-ketoacyl synthase-like protein n=1 Tax=Lachnotalea glycerini TaxID=1763509 RepID=A0A318ERF5_9FIRM|nr:beta-ketoacyl synthase-like protein [Lachnotalea glycerini]
MYLNIDNVICITSSECYVGKEKSGDHACVIDESYYIYYQGENKSRHFDRISKILLTGMSKLCDKYNLNMEKLKTAGIYLGTQYSSCNSIHTFDSKALNDSPLSVNPIHFPDTVINSPASQLSIEYKMENENFTISNGLNASLDAIGIAYESILSKATEIAIAGGVDEWGKIQSYGTQCKKEVAEAVGLVLLEEVKQDEARQKSYIQIISYVSENVKKDCILSADIISEVLRKQIEENLKDYEQKIEIFVSSLLDETDEKHLFEEAVKKSGFDIELHFNNKIYFGATGVVEVDKIYKKSKLDCSFQILLNLNKSILSCLIISRNPPVS